MTEVAVARRTTAELAIPESPEARRARIVHRFRQLAACLGIIGLCITQEPGRIIADTKLDMAIDPLSFLMRAGDLWNAQWQFGSLQNQATGYFFPMGPFFLGGSALDMPPWVIQRLWMAALLCVAFLGVVRLGAKLDIGTPNTRLLAGVVFALSPRALSLVGTVSGELIPYCLAPWALVPLVWGAHRGNPRRAAALSGLAIVCMSGVNGAAVAGGVLPCLIYLLTRAKGPRRTQLLRWWSATVVLGTFWWVASLALLAKYGFPFLPFTESAAVTTGTTSLSRVLRGASHWVAYLAVDGETWWRAGWTIATVPLLVVTTAVVAGFGLAGLARRDLVERRFLGYLAVTGVAILCSGFAAELGAPGAEFVRTALDGPLAPLRNLHKFDVGLRLAVAFGVAHLLAVWRGRAAQRPIAGFSDWRPALARVVTAGAMLLVVASAGLSGLPNTGSIEKLPQYWRQTASWLDRNAADSSTLLVPGSNFGEYVWGRTMDEPIQPLLEARWAVRGLVPSGSTGNARILAAIDERLAAGAASPGLPEVLSRLGVEYLVVRNDLSRPLSGVAWPILVHRTLDGTDGLRKVASFGPEMGADAFYDGVWDYNLRRKYPAVEIYQVTDEAPQVDTLDANQALRLTGAPESILDLADVDLLDGRPLVMDGDEGVPDTAVPVLADSLRWREMDFGLVRENTSPTLTAKERPRLDRATNDLVEPAWRDSWTTANYAGIRDVSASSSAAEMAGPPNLRDASTLPFAALDGDPDTFWLTDGAEGVRGQWLQVEFLIPSDPQKVTLSIASDELLGPGITEVEVSTETGSLVSPVPPDGKPAEIPVPAGDTRWLRVTAKDVDGEDSRGARSGIRELTIPGVQPDRVLSLPRFEVRPGAPAPMVALSRRAGDRPACTVADFERICAPPLLRNGEEATLTTRQFVLPHSYRPALTGLAAPRPETAAAIYAKQMTTPQFTVSSTRFADPVASGFALGDGDDGTAWIADPRDREPSASIAWGTPRKVDKIRMRFRGQVAASPAATVRISGDNPATTYEGPADSQGVVTFPAMTTKSLKITILGVVPRFNRSAGAFDEELLPLGMSGLDVPGVPGINKSPEMGTKISLPCGGGPKLRINGLIVQTRAEGLLRDIRDLRPLRYFQCESQFPVFLRAGQNSISALLDGFTVESAVLGTPAKRAGDGEGATTGRRQESHRPVTVEKWGNVQRTVSVAAGGQSYLVVNENVNAGWRATLNGKDLEPARLDGWRQAWIVPAGDGGRVHITFTPGTIYLYAEAVGIAGILLLLMLALWRRRSGDDLAPAPAAAWDINRARILALALALFIGGPGGFAVALAVVLVWWRRPPRAFLVFWAIVAAGVCEAVTRWTALADLLGEPVTEAIGGYGAQGFCLVALTVILVRLRRYSAGLSGSRWGWFRRRTEAITTGQRMIEA